MQSPVNGENFVEIGEVRLWTIAEGAGIPVLIFNGGPGCDDYLGPVAALLTHRCRVVRFEPRGCGRSTWVKRYDLDAQLEDADRIRTAYGYDRMVLLGHSYGPCVALAYAIRFPQHVIGVIGLAGGKVVNDRSWSEVYYQKKDEEDTGGLVFTADEEVNAQGNASWKEYCRRPGLFRDLADLPARTVFINGSEDIRPNWPTQQLARLIPNAKYVEITGAAHLLWRTHRDELKAELESALDFLSAGVS